MNSLLKNMTTEALSVSEKQDQQMQIYNESFPIINTDDMKKLLEIDSDSINKMVNRMVNLEKELREEDEMNVKFRVAEVWKSELGKRVKGIFRNKYHIWTKKHDFEIDPEFSHKNTLLEKAIIDYFRKEYPLNSCIWLEASDRDEDPSVDFEVAMYDKSCYNYTEHGATVSLILEDPSVFLRKNSFPISVYNEYVQHRKDPYFDSFSVAYPSIEVKLEYVEYGEASSETRETRIIDSDDPLLIGMHNGTFHLLAAWDDETVAIATKK
jgi:hypothetical protein